LIIPIISNTYCVIRPICVIFRIAYWRVILHSNIKQIDAVKKASVRAVIKYLRGLNDERLLNKGNADELFWIDDMVTGQRVVKKTVSNAVSIARKLPCPLPNFPPNFPADRTATHLSTTVLHADVTPCKGRNM